MTDETDTSDWGLDRRTVLKGAAAASAAGLVGVPAFSGNVAAGGRCIKSEEISLTWSRSAETSTGVEKSDVLEGAVSAGWGLDTASDGNVDGTKNGAVWNGDQYYQGEEGEFVDDIDFDWATWEHWDPNGDGAASDSACASGGGDDTPYSGSDNDDVYQVRKHVLQNLEESKCGFLETLLSSCCTFTGLTPET